MTQLVAKFGPYSVTRFARGAGKNFGYQIDREAYMPPLAICDDEKAASLIIVALGLADTYHESSMHPESHSRETCERMLLALIAGEDPLRRETKKGGAGAGRSQ